MLQQLKKEHTLADKHEMTREVGRAGRQGRGVLTAAQTDGQTGRNGRRHGRREKKRKEHRVQPSLRSRKVRKSEPSRCWKQKKYMAPARARECCLDQGQKKAVLRKGMRMVKGQNPRAGEGSGWESCSVITGQHWQVTGSPYLCSPMLFH